jgi:hypothetical protein
MVKGQFFILGAVLLVIVFSLGLPFIRPAITSPSGDLPYISRNLQREFPAAFNLGLNETSELSVMSNFSLFLNKTLYDKLVAFSAFWVYSRNSSSSVNITAGNFLGKNTTATLTLNTGKSTSRSMFVRHGGSNSTLFTGPGTIFNLTIEFESRSRTVEWLRDKANLYVFFELRRGQDLVKEEVVA